MFDLINYFMGKSIIHNDQYFVSASNQRVTRRSISILNSWW